MSLYAEYKLEREGKYTIENEYGFLTYQIDGESIYIENIFVTEKYRLKGIGAQLADEAIKCGKEKCCVKAIGSVVPNTNGATESIAAMLAYGFKLQASANNFIWLEKDI